MITQACEQVDTLTVYTGFSAVTIPVTATINSFDAHTILAGFVGLTIGVLPTTVGRLADVGTTNEIIGAW